MSRLIRSCAAVAVLCAAALAVATSSAAAKTCDIGNSRAYGTTYVVAISTGRVSCGKAKKLIRAYHACRPGKSGKCARVTRYRCSERRFNKSRQSYDSEVTCKRGGKRVEHTYTQFI